MAATHSIPFSRLAEVGVPLVPVGQPVRPLVHGATPLPAAGVPRRAVTGSRSTRHDYNANVS